MNILLINSCLLKLQIVITLYEVIHVFALGGTVGDFAAWAEVLIVANPLIVVFNSSINFAFYCGDTGRSEGKNSYKGSNCNLWDCCKKT